MSASTPRNNNNRVSIGSSSAASTAAAGGGGGAAYYQQQPSHTDAVRDVRATPDADYDFYDRNPRLHEESVSTVTGTFTSSKTTTTKTSTTVASSVMIPTASAAAAALPVELDDNRKKKEYEDNYNVVVDEEEEDISPPATYRAAHQFNAPNIDPLHPFESFSGGARHHHSSSPPKPSVGFTVRVARTLHQWRYPLCFFAVGPASQLSLQFMRSYTTQCLVSRGGGGGKAGPRGGVVVSGTSSSSSATTTTIVEHYPVTPDWAVEAREALPRPVASAASVTLWALGIPTLTALRHRQNIEDASTTTTTTINNNSTSDNNNNIASTVVSMFTAEAEDDAFPETTTPDSAAPFALVIAVTSAVALLFINTILLVDQLTEERQQQQEEEDYYNYRGSGGGGGNGTDDDGDDDNDGAIRTTGGGSGVAGATGGGVSTRGGTAVGNNGIGTTTGGTITGGGGNGIPSSTQQQNQNPPQSNTTPTNVPRLTFPKNGFVKSLPQQQQQREDSFGANVSSNDSNALVGEGGAPSSGSTTPQPTARHNTDSGTASAIARELTHHRRISSIVRPAPKIVVAVEGHLSVPEANLLLATIGEHNKYYEEQQRLQHRISNGEKDVSTASESSTTASLTTTSCLPPNIIEGVIFTQSPPLFNSPQKQQQLELEVVTEQDYRNHRRQIQRQEENPFLPPFLLQSMCSPTGSFSWINSGSSGTTSNPTSPTSPSHQYASEYRAARAAAAAIPLTTLLQSDEGLFPSVAASPEGYVPTPKTHFIVIPDSIEVSHVRHVPSVKSFATSLQSVCCRGNADDDSKYSFGNHQLTTVFVSIPIPPPAVTNTHQQTNPTTTPLSLSDESVPPPGRTTTTSSNSKRLKELLLLGSSNKTALPTTTSNSAKLSSILGFPTTTETKKNNKVTTVATVDLVDFSHPYDVMYVFSSSDLRSAAIAAADESDSTLSINSSSIPRTPNLERWCEQEVSISPQPAPTVIPSSSENGTCPTTTNNNRDRLLSLLNNNNTNRNDSFNKNSSNVSNSSGWITLSPTLHPITPLLGTTADGTTITPYPAAPMFAVVANLLNHRQGHVVMSTV